MKKKENKRAENKRESRFPNRDYESANRNSCPEGQAGANPTERNSTVIQFIKPSALGTFFYAEGCICVSQTVRACLVVRFFNN